MSAYALPFVALLLVLVLLVVIGGICVAAAVHAQTRSARVLFNMLACVTVIAFAITIALTR